MKFGVDYGPNIAGDEPDYEEMLRKRLAKQAYEEYMSGENFRERQKMEGDPDYAMGKLIESERARREEMAAKGTDFIKQSVSADLANKTGGNTSLMGGGSSLIGESMDNLAFADYAKKLRRDGKNQEFSRLMQQKYGSNAAIMSGKY